MRTPSGASVTVEQPEGFSPLHGDHGQLGKDRGGARSPFCSFSRGRLETLADARAEDRERPQRAGRGWGASCSDCFVPCPGFLPTPPRPSTAEPRGAQGRRAQEAAQTRVGGLKAPRQQEEVT